MGCEHVSGKGFRGIVCTRGERTKKCRWCKSPGTKLCDRPKPRGGTCDAPMCTVHATSIGENRDLCPDHALANEPAP